MRILKRPVRDDERISDLPDCSTSDSVKSDNQNRIDLIRRDETRDFTLNSSCRVRAKLPRFKGALGGITDPKEFLEIFGRNCNAHRVPTYFFLPLWQPACIMSMLGGLNPT